MLIGITGSTGVLGKELLKSINKKKYKISCFKGDITKRNELYNWFKKKKFDILIHLAAIVPIKEVNKDKKKAKKINYNGTENLINCIKKFSKTKKIWFFFSSTSHVYGYSKLKFKEDDNTKPLNYYAKTKLMSERLIIKNKNFYNYCIGRIFSYTSVSQNQNYFVPNVFKKLKSKNKIITFNNVNHFRDFLSLEDICLAINVLMNNKATGIFNICSSKKISLKKIINILNLKKKKLFFNENNKQTILFGDNTKLKKLKWKIKQQKYLKYLKNIYK